MATNYGRAPGHLKRDESVYADEDDPTGLVRRNLECGDAARYRGQATRPMNADGTLAPRKLNSKFPSLLAGQGRPIDQLVEALQEPDLAAVRDRKRKRDEEKGANVGMGITLEKLFGVSGRGIAGLVNVPAVNGGQPYQSVCKVDRRNINDVEKEEGLLQDFEGCKHIVQYDRNTRYFKNLRRSKKGNSRKPPSQYKDRLNIGADWKRNFVMMEYAELGNLLTWLQRTSAHAADPNSKLGPWPNKALWHLLECLTRGLIGMAYAPHGEASDQPGKVTDETVPPSPAPEIGDFGLMQDFSLLEENPNAFSERKFWQLRSTGKSGHFVPEQFCQEWDEFNNFMGFNNNGNKNRFIGQGDLKPPVAGNYGMASNVFQVGIILWMAITLHVAPGTRAFRTPLEAGVGVMVDSTFMRSNGQSLRTYGGALEDERFNHVEGVLRELVIRCMAHNPADRPDLSELIEVIDDRLRSPFNVDGDELDQWYQDLFGRPPPQADGKDEEGNPIASDLPRTGFSSQISNERASRAKAETGGSSSLTQKELQTLRDALSVAKAVKRRAPAGSVFGELIKVLQKVPGVKKEKEAAKKTADDMAGGEDKGGEGDGGNETEEPQGRSQLEQRRAGKRKRPPSISRRETRQQAKRRMAAASSGRAAIA
ncbi:hypothetical protein D7B24_005757 [Verticillium nonalfalfae]|uniref:Protein kinase domain-containing protein n=1 Tax=Verticillium nonalfalfae TaxID=1051616 RepID=A0A3M9YC20_9PEZI|nr:uncharacterized protein D7B24_005757 [Verticillium nonalfalfae]RNJ57675.1 hypothetical protein D7B24_005757 [Verticillium nonalfalfae]